jgi:hypothetical protein
MILLAVQSNLPYAWCTSDIRFCNAFDARRILRWSVTMHVNERSFLLAATCCLVFGVGGAIAQQPATAPNSMSAASVPAQTPTAPVAATDAKSSKKKPKKAEYTGPNTLIVLPATPMLDEEGKQRLDPDGQPMFNPPLKQQRDKKGHPLFNEQGKPVFQTATNQGYDEHGKKLRAPKVKEAKMTPVSISRGTFTVDGMIGKAELNYEIPNFKYMYMYAPGIGTLVVSNAAFPGAKEQKGAFNDATLTVTVGEHKLQLASDKRLLGKKPESAYVLVDRDFNLPSKYPVVGYGTTLKAPYTWPGGRPNGELAGSFVAPPPIPTNLQPVLLQSPCSTGQMRKASPPTLPGQTAQPQPCVPMAKGSVAASKGVASDAGLKEAPPANP